MRNGNQENAFCEPYVLRSYRTYEEWKLFEIPNNATIEGLGSYRTYEEWKRFLNLM